MAPVDAIEALRRELAMPPVDLAPLLAEMGELRRMLYALTGLAAGAPEQLLGVAEVCARTGMGRTVLLERLRDGGFPAAREHGGRTLLWRAADVDAWIAGLPARPYAGGGPDAR